VTNIKEFLATFSKDQKFFLNLPVFWTVTFDSINSGAINSVLSKAGEKWQAKENISTYIKGGNILVAQQVNIPNEGSTFNAYGSGSNMGGFLAGLGMENRDNFLSRGITVNFLETQKDIDQYFFRPWAIAIGIKGLIEHGPSLKGNMTVKQYTNKGQFIKGFKFQKIFPTAVEGYSLNYSDTEFKQKSVTFGCQNYQQL
jgi:hypothetical protein